MVRGMLFSDEDGAILGWGNLESLGLCGGGSSVIVCGFDEICKKFLNGCEELRILGC